MACDIIEDGWRSSQYASLKSLLSGFSDLERPAALKEMLAVELERRIRQNERPNREEYVSNWPEYVAVIHELFDTVVERMLRTTLNVHHRYGASSKPVTKPHHLEETPAKIGKYAIVERLDGGGQATVFRAIHPELRRDVVIKFCHTDATVRPDMKEALAAEGRMLASLDHPNLAKVFDFDLHEGRPYLVMEFVQGLNLAQYRKQHGATRGIGFL